jgi:hypothetical protein
MVSQTPPVETFHDGPGYQQGREREEQVVVHALGCGSQVVQTTLQADRATLIPSMRKPTTILRRMMRALDPWYWVLQVHQPLMMTGAMDAAPMSTQTVVDNSNACRNMKRWRTWNRNAAPNMDIGKWVKAACQWTRFALYSGRPSVRCSHPKWSIWI